MTPEYVIQTLEKEDANAKSEPEGHKWSLAREDWANVVKIHRHSWTQHRHGGIAYLYCDLYAVLKDGTKRPIRQVGPYKFNDRRWERDEKEAEQARKGRSEEAKIWATHFMEFFKSQTPEGAAVA